MGARKLLDTYIIAIPFGIFGAHHFFLKRYVFGILYACTFGLFGIGYVVDLIRMKWLVRHTNHKADKIMESDVYLLCAVLGPFGGHHFYLENRRLAYFYLLTFGVFGFGWIGDLFRVKSLITEASSKDRSLGTARILALSPSGLFGAHHYYLKSYKLALLYSFTFGVFGTGWLVDQFRITDLVKEANGSSGNTEGTEIMARILCASPLGIIGVHHFYLKRHLHGILYLFTLGWFGIGWLYDMFRLPVLYRRYKENDKHLYIDDAYMLWFPFGIFGLHQFYLKRNKWAVGYACTCGVVGVGWIMDAFRLKQLVDEHNKGLEPIVQYQMTLEKCSIRETFCFCCFNKANCAEDDNPEIVRIDAQNENISEEGMGVSIEIIESAPENYGNTSEEEVYDIDTT